MNIRILTKCTLYIVFAFTSACVTSTADKETELLKKENELLKKENELFKRMEEKKETDSISHSNNKLNDNKIVPFGNFKIVRSFDCNIDFGRIQTAKPENGKFRFRIDINNKGGYEGAVDGYAYFTSENEAVFKDANCKSIIFTYLPNKTITLKETNCDEYHGANICFNGEYVFYKK